MKHLTLTSVLKACVVVLMLSVTYVLFETFFNYLWQTWQVDPFYTQGPWVAAVAVGLYLFQIRFLLYNQNFYNPSAAFKPMVWRRYLGCLLGFILSFGAGVYTHIAFLGGIGFCFWMLLINQILFPKAKKGMHFPAFYFLTVVPLPFLGEISGLLQVFIARISTQFLNLLGYGVFQSGMIVGTSQVQFQIAPSCTGIASWLVLVSLVLFFLYFIPGALWKKILLFILILPIAFLSNWARVLFLILMGIYYGEQKAMAFWHTYGGLSFYVLACGLTFLTMLILFRKKHES